jgi:hypothetical protein
MWNVIDVTELGCELDEPDLWANWAAIKPSQIV